MRLQGQEFLGKDGTGEPRNNPHSSDTCLPLQLLNTHAVHRLDKKPRRPKRRREIVFEELCSNAVKNKLKTCGTQEKNYSHCGTGETTQ